MDRLDKITKTFKDLLFLKNEIEELEIPGFLIKLHTHYSFCKLSVFKPGDWDKAMSFWVCEGVLLLDSVGGYSGEEVERVRKLLKEKLMEEVE